MPKVATKTKNAANTECDVLIAGGGLVGASLALALAPSGLNIVVVEAFAFDSAQQPSYDERTIALTYSSKLIFQQIGVWTNEVESSACPIEQIHISNRGHMGITHLNRHHAGTPALGYVVPTRSLGASLNEQMARHDNIRLICPAQVLGCENEESGCLVEVETGEKTGEKAQKINSQLLVIADGGRSPLLAQQGFKVDKKPYVQSALLTIVSADREHQNQAFERFTSSGPLALLPMTDQRYAVVWTLLADELKAMQSLDDDAFIAALQQAFGYRAGRLSAPTPRKSYPLSLDMLDKPVKDKVVVVGNAAHKVHPVAGQGFNLGLRDAAALAELINDAQIASTDIASPALLQRYQQWRAAETQRVGRFTDGMISVFSSDAPLLALGRNMGLKMVEHLPMAKRFLLRRTMGLASHQPRLALGKALRKQASSNIPTRPDPSQ